MFVWAEGEGLGMWSVSERMRAKARHRRGAAE